MRIQYRPEIDGLRAIAVTSVIFYHAEIEIYDLKFFQGGFLGVDIFFVISGYLLSKIIFIEITSTKNFSFKKFYIRRIMRIFPALFFVILISMPFAWFYLTPSHLVDFSNSIISATFMISNVYFYLNEFNYWAQNLVRPYLHTWSLAVEEQIYLFLPIFFYIFLKFNNKNKILIILFFISFLSLSFAYFFSSQFPKLNFYLPFSRIWEFFFGSIIGLYEIKKQNMKKFNNTWKLIISYLSIIILIISIFIFNSDLKHPSLISVIPVISTCLFILTANSNSLIFKILTSKVFILIGLISYSLYLWHYPIFAFLKITEIAETNFLNIFLYGGIILFVSSLSYLFIEKPFRNNKRLNINIIILLSLFVLIIISNMLIIKNDGYQNRFESLVNNLNLINQSSIIKKKSNIDIISNDQVVYKNKEFQNIILVGDSHSETISYELYENLKKQNNNFLTSIIYGCPFILNLKVVNRENNRVVNKCTIKRQKQRFDFINNNKNSIVILFSKLPYHIEGSAYDTKGIRFQKKLSSNVLQDKNNSLANVGQRERKILDELKKTIELLIKNNHKVIIIYPVPEVGLNLPDWTIKNKDKDIIIPYEEYLNRVASTHKILDSIKNEKVYKIVPSDVFCNINKNDVCLTKIDNKLLYKDDNHLSLHGGSLLAKKILNKINIINNN